MVLPAFTTDETLLCRAEAYTLLKQYDKAAADIDAWQKAFTKYDHPYKESINSFYAALSYYTPENTANPSVKRTPSGFYVGTRNAREFDSLYSACAPYSDIGEGLRWQDIKRYGIVIYRRYFEGSTLVRITDTMGVDDPRRAVQLPSNVITAGMEPNPRND